MEKLKNFRVAWWEDASLRTCTLLGSLLVEEKGGPATGHPCRTVLALPGEGFIRRAHPRPFSNILKLRRILPGLLENTLFEVDRGACQTGFSLDGPEAGKFSSFSVRGEVLQDFVEKTARRAAPIVSVLPLPAGLAWFAREKAPAVVVGPVGENVAAVLVSPGGDVADFRELSPKIWKEQAQMTLAGWGEVFPQTTFLRVGDTFMPKAFQTVDVQLPPTIKPERAAVYGLLHRLSHRRVDPLPLSVADGVTAERLKAVSKGLLPWAWSFFLVVAATLGALWWQGSGLNSELAQLRAKSEEIFTTAMPANTPVIDPLLQVSRRMEELSILAGKEVSGGASFVAQLAQLQALLAEKKVVMNLDELRVDAESFRLRGRLPALTDVDALQGVLGELFPGFDITLRNASLVENQVEFSIEGKEKS